MVVKKNTPSTCLSKGLGCSGKVGLGVACFGLFARAELARESQATDVVLVRREGGVGNRLDRASVLWTDSYLARKELRTVGADLHHIAVVAGKELGNERCLRQDLCHASSLVVVGSEQPIYLKYQNWLRLSIVFV